MSIPEKEYMDFLKANGLLYRESNLSHSGYLVWAVSTDGNDRLILHDCCGNAYKGLKVSKKALFNFKDFCPAYGNKVLTPSSLKMSDIKVKRIIHKMDGSVVWGVSELRPNHYLVIDYYGRVYTGLVLNDGEEILLEQFAPVYHGKLLKPAPKLKLRKKPIKLTEV